MIKMIFTKTQWPEKSRKTWIKTILLGKMSCKKSDESGKQNSGVDIVRARTIKYVYVLKNTKGGLFGFDYISGV
jgi:hypothetical protein